MPIWLGPSSLRNQGSGFRGLSAFLHAVSHPSLAISDIKMQSRGKRPNYLVLNDGYENETVPSNRLSSSIPELSSLMVKFNILILGSGHIFLIIFF